MTASTAPGTVPGEPILPFARGSVFVDGTLGDVRLKHPEGIAVADDGAIWCGGDGGEIYRVAPDGSSFEQIASTGGFTLGIAFDGAGGLFTCDLGHKAVFRLDLATRELTTFAASTDATPIRIPNFPVVDRARGCLYVSDSFGSDGPGPGIWRFDRTTGHAQLWYDRPLTFANGMALSPDRSALYVVETFAHSVCRIPIRPDGRPGEREVVAESIERLPDGLAFDAAGNLYISCYEPSRIYRLSPKSDLALLYDDPDAHMLCHPTNCAFRGSDLFTANLGRWHITRIAVDSPGLPLP